MIREPKNFVEFCLSGQALAEDIYEFIDSWHASESELQLPEYLGMSVEEYNLWLERPESLGFIIFAHQTGVPLLEALKMSEGVRVAARAADKDAAREVLAWLRKTNRI